MRSGRAKAIRRAAALVAVLGILPDLRAQEPGKDVIQVAPAGSASRVPDLLRQGTFVPPQAVSAVEVSGDGRSIGVTTLAFRHDRNFWLLSSEGEPLWGRHVAPCAPFQVASSPGGSAFAVGLAYSRVTGPQPTISILGGEKAGETEVIRTKALAFRPDVVFTGHDAHKDGTAFLEDLVRRSEESIRKATEK